MLKKITLFVLCACTFSISLGQVSLSNSIDDISYKNPVDYTVGGIIIEGTQFLDHKTLIQFSGIEVGQRITVPGDDITKATEILWKQGLFSDVQISAEKIQGNSIFLKFYLLERARLSKFKFSGIKKADIDELRDRIKLVRGKIITENLITNTSNIVKDYFVEKGFYNITVSVEQLEDTKTKNHKILAYNITKGDKVKINEITFEGNTLFTEGQLRRMMKDTKVKKKYRIFKASKFLKDAYEADKDNIIAKYNQKGYRDAKIIRDSIYRGEEDNLNIRLSLKEGSPYFFGNIAFVGNTKYTNEELKQVVGIEKGDIYNEEVVQIRLLGSPDSRDVHSKYLDNGYLFSQVTPIEIEVRNDTIDLEVRIYEGQQARVNKVSVIGNTKTNDHVIMRELHTKPGDLFNRSLIMRSQRELATLNYFNAENLDIDVEPNQKDGTVDLTYVVEEKPSDQIELQGGWGANRVVGTFRVSFNNFSAKNIFNGESWTPLPSGDGQRLSLSASSNGLQYQSYNINFTEPWLGGKKPNALSVGAYYSITSNGLEETDTARGDFKVKGLTIGLGKRLKWPDDYFTLYQNLSFKIYEVNNYNLSSFDEGTFYNYSYSFVLGRNSVDQPTFPRRGSKMEMSVQLTPPYSLFDGVDDYSTLEPAEVNKWVEYHKWNIGANWFTSLANKLVLKTNLEYGFIGKYTDEKELSQFERYYVGGDGLSGYSLDGREVIALRGYSNNSLSPSYGATIYNKYTMEMRYALSLNPQSPIYALAFLEAGNTWNASNNFNPFDIKRSAGVGIRISIPMIGIMGVDYGYGYDEITGNPDANGGQFHFSINQQF